MSFLINSVGYRFSLVLYVDEVSNELIEILRSIPSELFNEATRTTDLTVEQFPDVSIGVWSVAATTRRRRAHLQPTRQFAA